jgi:hypothetical protein
MGGYNMANSTAHLKIVANSDGAVILDVARNEITTMNPSGALVWELLRQGFSVAAIAHQLAEKTNTEISVVEQDIRDFLEDLGRRALLPSDLEELSCR